MDWDRCRIFLLLSLILSFPSGSLFSKIRDQFEPNSHGLYRRRCLHTKRLLHGRIVGTRCPAPSSIYRRTDEYFYSSFSKVSFAIITDKWKVNNLKLSYVKCIYLTLQASNSFQHRITQNRSLTVSTFRRYSFHNRFLSFALPHSFEKSRNISKNYRNTRTAAIKAISRYRSVRFAFTRTFADDLPASTRDCTLRLGSINSSIK